MGLLKQEGNGRRNTVTTARIANISIDVHFFYAKETMQKDDGWVGAVRCGATDVNMSAMQGGHMRRTWATLIHSHLCTVQH